MKIDKKSRYRFLGGMLAGLGVFELVRSDIPPVIVGILAPMVIVGAAFLPTVIRVIRENW